MGKTLRKYCLCLPRTNSNEMKIFNILLLGLSNSGKTEIGHRIVGETRRDFALTNGVRRYNKTNRHILWNITEIGGSFDMQRIWHYYFVKTMGIIFTIDLSNMSSIPKAFKKLEEIVHHTFIQGKPILILLTKGDLVLGANVSISDIEEFYKLENLANTNQCPMLLEEFSLDDDTEFMKGVQWLDNIIKTNYKKLKNRTKFDTNIQSGDLNNGKKVNISRPLSAPPFKNAKIKPVKKRLRLVSITRNSNAQYQNGLLRISDIQSVEIPSGKEIPETNSATSNEKQIFGQKVEHRIFKSNKVADLSVYKHDLKNKHILNKENTIC